MIFPLVFSTIYVASAVELLVLQDVSNGALITSDIPSKMQSVIETLGVEFEGDLKVAVASFVDKPNVHVGTGTYGGWPGPYQEDWCYKLVSPLASAAEASPALSRLGAGSGMDVLEGHFEALMRGAIDPDMGWSEDDEKVIMIVTDNFGHCVALNTLAEHVLKYNTPVRCVGGDVKTKGGVGAYETADAMENWIRMELRDTYYDFAELVYRKTCLGDLSEEELALLEEKKVEYGPLRVPSVKPFDIEKMKEDPEEHCRYYEYPDYSDMTAVLADKFKVMVVLYEESSSSVFGTWDWTLTDAIALGNVTTHLTHIVGADGFETTVLSDLKTFLTA